MAKIYVDNIQFEVHADQNVLQACLSLGFDLPYFCWHPALGSVGACRQCAVKQFRNEQDTRGKLVMACMTPCAEGTRISIADAEASAFRAAVIEGLMLSHPHDCPVCDEGGECHLQDMTVMTGHDYRRYGSGKRTFRNQYLGPFINHEMNRCIQCYRCVRFYREYAGGRDLNSFALRNTVYFGRHEDGVLESEFSGNLVEVCPTGVFTDATLGRHYTRKWDLRFAPSVCVHCALGCNTSPGERYGMLRRVLNRYNGEVNGYFLCDRGRFGYEFVNSPKRLRKPVLRRDGALRQVSEKEALGGLASLLAGDGRVIGIGSPRASLEANFALRRMVGPQNFYAGIPEDQDRMLRLILEILRAGPARTPSLREVELCDAVFILGEDVAGTAPRMALALRQSVRQQPMRAVEKMRIPLWLDQAVREAVQDAKGPLFLATTCATRLDDVAAETCRGAPDDLARLGFAVASRLDPAAQQVPGMTDALSSLAGRIASALKQAQRPLVIAGTNAGSEALIRSAATVSRALHAAGRPAALSLVAPECNSLGLALMGAGNLAQAMAPGGGRVSAVVLENDLYRRASRAAVDAFLDALDTLVVIDHIEQQTSGRAAVALPAGTFAESDGTFVSCEGRAQRYFQVFVPEAGIRESWRWLRDAMVDARRLDADAWQSLDDVLRDMAAELPDLAPARAAAPPAAFRMPGGKVPRAPHRYSGRTAATAHITVHEPPPPDDPDSPLSFSMEGASQQPPASLTPFFWAPGWNSIQSLNRFQEEIEGPLRGGDAGVRLIEPGCDGPAGCLDGIPPGFEPRQDEWLVVPLHHVFGSEELSVLSPSIGALAPQPAVALNARDALRLRLQEGDTVELRLADEVHRVPVRLAPVALGTAGFAGIPRPAWGRIVRVS